MSDHSPTLRPGPPSAKRRISRSPDGAPRKATRKSTYPPKDSSYPSLKDVRRSSVEMHHSDSISSSRHSSVHGPDARTHSHYGHESIPSNGKALDEDPSEDVIFGFMHHLQKWNIAKSRHDLSKRRIASARKEYEDVESNFQNWPNMEEKMQNLKAQTEKELSETETMVTGCEASFANSLRDLVHLCSAKPTSTNSDHVSRASYNELLYELKQTKLDANNTQQQVYGLEKMLREQQAQLSQQSSATLELVSLRAETRKIEELQRVLQRHDADSVRRMSALDRHTNTISRLEEHNQRHEQQIKDLWKEQSKNRQECQKWKASLKDLTRDLEQIKTRIEQIDDKTADDYQTLHNRLEDQRAELRRLELREMQAQEVSASLRANASRNEINEVRMSIKILQERIFGNEALDQEHTLLERTQKLSEDVHAIKQEIDIINEIAPEKEAILNDELNSIQESFTKAINEKGGLISSSLHETHEKIQDTLKQLQDRPDAGTVIRNFKNEITGFVEMKYRCNLSTLDESIKAMQRTTKEQRTGDAAHIRRELRSYIDMSVEASRKSFLGLLHEKIGPIQDALKDVQDQPSATAVTNGVTNSTITPHGNVNGHGPSLPQTQQRLDALVYAVQDLERRFGALQTDELMQMMLNQMTKFYPAPAKLQQAVDIINKGFDTFKTQVSHMIQGDQKTLHELGSMVGNARTDAADASKTAAVVAHDLTVAKGHIGQLEKTMQDADVKLVKTWSPRVQGLERDLRNLKELVDDRLGASRNDITIVRTNLTRRLVDQEVAIGGVQEEIDRIARLLGAPPPNWER